MKFNNKAAQGDGSMNVSVASKLVAPTSLLIVGDRALALSLSVSISTIRTWRTKRVIPFIKTGHKSIAYELADVLSALRAFRTKPITEKGAR